MLKKLVKTVLDRWQTSSVTGKVNENRRSLVTRLLMGSGLLAMGSKTIAAEEPEQELRFPGDPPDNKVVYQFNKADDSYHKAVLFSVGAMVRKYGDNIKIVVVGIGPGLHILAKNPKRPVSDETKQRVSSLEQYGVEFHVCGNTMKALGWTMDDMLPFTKYVEVGAADLMELQADGFSYISW